MLKNNGKIIIYEPNKLNPILWLMHYFDKNEIGLLEFGTPKSYKKLFHKNNFEVVKCEFNGIVVGPQSKIFFTISRILNFFIFKPFLKWLNPKIFLIVKSNK